MSSTEHDSKRIEKYLKGEMSAEEAHAFERAALNDPFLYEALQGLEEHSTEEVLMDIEALKTKVERQRKSIPWLHIAASISLLVIGSLSIYYFGKELEKDELATQEPALEQLQPSLETTPTDSTVLQEIVPKDKKLTQPAPKIAEQVIARNETTGISIAEKPLNPQKDISQPALAEMDTEKAAELDGDLKILPLEKDVTEDLTGRVAGVETLPDEGYKEEIYAASTISMLAQAEKQEEELEAEEPVSALDNSSALGVEKAARNSKKKMNQTNLPRLITGTVISEFGEPLPGVTVTIKGTATGAITDIEGKFRIETAPNMTLLFSYIGFKAAEVSIGNKETIDVTLTEDDLALEEVVVVGYGTANEIASPSFSAAKPSTGWRAYKKYLNEALIYPEAAKNKKTEGTVVLVLTVDASGHITDTQVKKSLGDGCDEEAQRLVKNGPQWKAAQRNGEKVGDSVKVKVKFQLDEKGNH